MAITATENRRTLLLMFVDPAGQTFYHQIGFESGTVEQLMSYADTYIARVHACVDCAIVGGQLIIDHRANDTQAAASGSDVTDALKLVLTTPTGYGSVEIPAIDPDLLIPYGPLDLRLDTTDPNVIAYLNLLTGGSYSDDQGALFTSLAYSSRNIDRQVR